jgi:hypothetical protein
VLIEFLRDTIGIQSLKPEEKRVADECQTLNSEEKRVTVEPKKLNREDSDSQA